MLEKKSATDVIVKEDSFGIDLNANEKPFLCRQKVFVFSLDSSGYFLLASCSDWITMAVTFLRFSDWLISTGYKFSILFFLTLF